ncbi:MAG: type II CAAX endopeptidase family protein [Chloroflexota bacterium]
MVLQGKNRNFIQKIFLSSEENRLRAGWRLLVQTFFLVIIAILVGAFFFIPAAFYSNLLSDFHFMMINNGITMFAGITLSVFLTRKYFDKKSITSLGLQISSLTIKEICIGIGISFFQMGLIILLEIEMGWNKITGFAWQQQSTTVVLSEVLFWLLFFIFVGWQEELLSRGYHLQTIESGINTFWAVIIASSVFALLHIANPEATWISTAGIFLAGLYLAIPYLLSRRLWLSIGLHIGWNFFEGVVFGFPVSGTTTFNLLNIQVSGPVLWTGGKFGPEAGLVLIPGLLLGVILIYIYWNIFSGNDLSGK